MQTVTTEQYRSWVGRLGTSDTDSVTKEMMQKVEQTIAPPPTTRDELVFRIEELVCRMAAEEVREQFLKEVNDRWDATNLALSDILTKMEGAVESKYTVPEPADIEEAKRLGEQMKRLRMNAQAIRLVVAVHKAAVHIESEILADAAHQFGVSIRDIGAKHMLTLGTDEQPLRPHEMKELLPFLN